MVYLIDNLHITHTRMNLFDQILIDDVLNIILSNCVQKQEHYLKPCDSCCYLPKNYYYKKCLPDCYCRIDFVCKKWYELINDKIINEIKYTQATQKHGDMCYVD